MATHNAHRRFRCIRNVYSSDISGVKGFHADRNAIGTRSNNSDSNDNACGTNDPAIGLFFDCLDSILPICIELNGHDSHHAHPRQYRYYYGKPLYFLLSHQVR